MADGEIKVVFTADDAAIQAKVARLNASISLANDRMAAASARAASIVETSAARSLAAEDKLYSGAAANAEKLMAVREESAAKALAAEERLYAAMAKSEAIKEDAASRALIAEDKLYTTAAANAAKLDAVKEQSAAKALIAEAQLEAANIKSQAVIMEAQKKMRALQTPPVLRTPSGGGAPSGGGSGAGRGINLSGLSALSISGIPYISTLARALTSWEGAIAAAISGLIRLLKGAFQRMADAINAAASTYAKQLQSGGLPAQFSVRRQTLAKILGVGEDEVLKFGSAVSYLNGKVALANEIFVKTNRILTATAWEFRVLQTNLSALWASVTTGASSALTGFAMVMNKVVEAAIRFTDHPIIQAFIKSGQVAAGYTIGGPIGAAITAALQAIGMGASAPQANVGMNRMPTSSWERMGLAIGFGNTNPAQQTANNTRQTAQQATRTNQLMTQLISALTGQQPAHNAP